MAINNARLCCCLAACLLVLLGAQARADSLVAQTIGSAGPPLQPGDAAAPPEPDEARQIKELQKQIGATCKAAPRTDGCAELQARLAQLQGRQAAVAKIVELNAFLNSQSSCLDHPRDNIPKSCAGAAHFATLKGSVKIYVASDDSVARAITRGTLKSPTPAQNYQIPTDAIAYLDERGQPISMAAYDWRTCQRGSGSGGGSSGGDGASAGPVSDFLTRMAKYVIAASDPYSLAYQTACSSSAIFAVPNDPIYQNSGATISAGFNSFAVSGNQKVSGSGTGKFVGAIAVDIIPLTKELLGQPAAKSFCPDCHLFPYFGLDYEYSQKSTSTNEKDVSTLYNVKEYYGGVAFTSTLSLDPILHRISPRWTYGLDNDCVFMNAPDRDDFKPQITAPINLANNAGREPILWGPGDPDYPNQNLRQGPAGFTVQSPTLDQYWPAPAASAGCSHNKAEAGPGAPDYYVWERNTARPEVELNVTTDLFVLRDQINKSTIGVWNARFVPFFLLANEGLDISLGVNQYNRPPIYIGSVPTYNLVLDPTGSRNGDGNGFCAPGSFCGFDWDVFHDTRIALVLDGRVDAGDFFQRGLPQSDPTLQQNYFRLGARTGLVAEFNIIRNNPVAVEATYLDYLAFSGFRHSMGLSQIEADYVLPNLKSWSIALAFEDGRKPETAARVQDWTLSLKYSPGK